MNPSSMFQMLGGSMAGGAPSGGGAAGSAFGMASDMMMKANPAVGMAMKAGGALVKAFQTDKHAKKMISQVNDKMDKSKMAYKAQMDARDEKKELAKEREHKAVEQESGQARKALRSEQKSMYDTIGRSGMAGSGSAQSALAEAESDLVGQAEGAVSDVREQRDIEESKADAGFTQAFQKYGADMEKMEAEKKKWEKQTGLGALFS